jgi:SAM-dependent methyltransferase
MAAETATKDPCFLRRDRRAAFTRFCERVYGRMLNQYGTADLEQLELLLRTLKLKSGARVLDAGCGTGSTTRYLAERSGATFVGIDISVESVERARQIAEGDAQPLEFHVATMEAPNRKPGSFDAVIAIDSLYFSKALEQTIQQLTRLLRAGGQMGLLYAHIAQAPERGLGPGDTKLAAALKTNALCFEASNLSESDSQFWRRSKEVAEELRADFEVEGNGDLTRLNEADAVLDLVRQGRHARYLYHVTT